MRARHRHNILIKIDIIGQRNWTHDSAKADVMFVAFRPLRSHVFSSFLLLGMLSLHKHHLKSSFLESWCKRDLEGAQEENFRLPCVHKCSAPGKKKALCFISVLKSMWMSTSSNLLVFTAVIKLSAFADGMWAQHRDHVDGLHLFSVTRIVLAVVTRFFASVFMWMFAASPDLSIHNPQRNWHERKYCMKEYNSATVVESTVFLIFWLS